MKQLKMKTLKKTLSQITGHLRLLWVRSRQDLSDPNQTWMVIIVCLLSLAMSLRMADAAGWVHFAPLTHIPAADNTTLVHQSNTFWNAVTNPSASCLLLLIGTLSTMLARLERWQGLMECALFALMGWWWLTAGTMVFQLGLSVGSLYLVVAVTSCVASVKTLKAFRHRTIKEAEVDESVRLVALTLDAHGLVPYVDEPPQKAFYDTL